ncbi:Male-specific lethal 1 [Merluccius polli]|uniref:Male-specific lethal 1 n=1 Tax=Merluccius polli TaxID=89951 RepID=A0AA47MCI7_MERPO|nr:Male-specific lethal 1 [Merluccius polli]
MTLRPTLYPNPGFKLNADAAAALEKSIGGGVAAAAGPAVLNAGVEVQVPLPARSTGLDQSRDPPAEVLLQEEEEEEEDAAAGTLSPVRQMGGEGTPVKGKPLPIDNMDNPQMAVHHHHHHNNNNNHHHNNHPAKDADGRDESAKGVGPGVLGTASIELSAEGKWRNIRKTPANPHSQANCLRQILLLQLDLIEQQQQQLQSKDKEIDELKTEKETLLARIERMERRLQLTKKDPRDKRLFQPLEPWTPDKDDMWDMDVEESPHSEQATPLAFSRGGKGQKRKICFGDPKLQKSRGKCPKSSPQKLEIRPGSPYHRELRSKETPEKAGPVRLGQERDSLLTCKEEPELCPLMEQLPFMCTTEMYLCCWHQPPLSPLRETSPKKEEDVAIPSWRENCIEPLDVDNPNSIPEALDDNVYLKRHLKLELDEKRRKRWDIQRIREQRMFQRLQQRMNKKKVREPESEPELSSFYPDTEDVESIVITPFLPVVAFGRPLPKLTQQNFELPWLDDRSRCRIEVPKKHTPHRTCRK